MSNIQDRELSEKAKIRLQWHGDQTRVLLKGEGEKTDVNQGDVIEVCEEQARELLSYSDLWTLEGEKPVEQPWRKAQHEAAVRMGAEAKARVKAKAKAEKVEKTEDADESEDDKEPEIEVLTEADVDLMSNKKDVSAALKARKVAHNSRGASLDELKALLKETLAAESASTETSTEDADEAEDGEDEESGEEDAE